MLYKNQFSLFSVLILYKDSPPIQVMKIIIANDHAGYEYKRIIVEYLASLKHDILDLGCQSVDSVDYPLYAHALVKKVEDFDFGILICGSGNGMSMVANKHPNVRAALCWNTETVELARQHNDANVLCLPARFITEDQVKLFAKKFIETEFDGGRHSRRVLAIQCSYF